MMDEPKGELARYAFGYSDKKPGWLFWVIHAAMVAFVLGMLWSGKAYAHCYSRWYYPTPQHCRLSNAPTPILHRAEEQSHDWYVEFVLPEDERIKAIDQLRVQLNKD